MFTKASNMVLNSSVFLAVKGQEKLQEMLTNEKGVTAIEYSMIAVAVSAMLYIVLGDGTSGDNFLGKIITAFDKIKDSIDQSMSAFPTAP
ncbi:Flp pilus assembly protein%2C pilin Flp [Yersinia massiliensis]|jgi:pilus assembly protein Flp/PilA|uniref:Flp pilus assembly protein, pilin Flp n=1 Tax=Yersinia intermedia TaxID=631 RepID=A0A0H5M0C1_YERIN|nr:MULTISPECIES: Flp family type IVb pilin [Yersinia]HEC1651836.1 Flp family type IVb pilin [Yersinia enterocolitica]MCB5309832.1 Flp family type IVb pilin [Yersinia massiliensis]CNI14149.1 Flp pilus assembly protein%2C pilin Flp [Yersinia massiliensis]CNM01582.1 Flp pilus assembly protein%2C pilin Flp [Yersinia frederiksenii]CRY56914.1 Flp pilus assembly protein%2C pilin Flp [Yersinia intermedia]